MSNTNSKELGSLLFKALTLAKSEELTSNNTRITKELGSIINKHFKNRANTTKVAGIIRRGVVDNEDIKINTPTNKTNNNFVEWTGNSKHTNMVQKGTIPTKPDVAGNGEDNDLDSFDIVKVAQMTPNTLLNTYSTITKIKSLQKQLGFSIDANLVKDDYLQAFIDECKNLL